MKPICVPCQRFFYPEENGFAFLEGMPTDNARPGKEDAAKWKPYKLWSGDKWRCPGCGTEIVVGTGASPVAEHYETNFEETVKRYDGAKFQVNDC